MRFLSICLVVLAFLTAPAFAESTITVSGAAVTDYAAKRAGGAPMPLAVRLTIHNAGTDADRLVRVKADAASSAELHTMEMSGGVMRMRRARSFDIPAGGDKVLDGKGDHIMLMGVKRPVPNNTVNLTLTFAKAGNVSVAVPVSTPAPRADVDKAMKGHENMPDMDHSDHMEHMDHGQ